MIFKRILCVAVGACCLAALAGGQTDEQILNRLLRGHFELYGDSANRERIQSLSLEGVQIHGGAAYPLSIHKKRPNLLRFRIGTEHAYVVIGFDGEQAWREWRTPARNDVEALPAEAYELLSDETTFGSPLQGQLFDPGVEATLGERVEIDGEAAYEVLLSVGGHPDRRYFISDQSRRLLKIEHLNGAGEVVLETFYRDYHDVGRFPMAYEIENLTPEGDVVLTRFEEIRLNSGLLSLYFEPPAGLAKPGLAD